ncbi:sulfite exporter TauE/SafE family protein [Alteromonas aestuariivivens]|uniref:Probable membrane transporter protein n=1 Tax=Alteromonas aestuariivivens TaxID=1938339 RepID=A0A3D8MEW4_9ALTE|nr:sulfite exporter TauE/SafE family protein [Alteromonas aestuariivivens]RDV29347.1 sulfite exporter TauE/SafE family protein [Alteromonas aestuariivivens]
MLEWASIYLLLILGAVLQNTIGFGLGLLCAPILLHLSPELVPVPMILNALLITLIIAWRHHQHVEKRQVSYAILGGTAGVVLASVAMVYIDHQTYRFLFGCIIIVAVLLSLIGIRPKVTNQASAWVGALSGVMGTLTSAGGAPMGLLYQQESRNTIKANLSVFFIYINAAGALGLAVSGYATTDDLINFLLCAPAVLFGWWLSRFVNRRIDGNIIRPLILTVAFLAGIAAVFY